MYVPHIVNEEKPGHNWGMGFLASMSYMHKLWEKFISEDNPVFETNCIFALAADGNPEAESQVLVSGTVEELRDILLYGIPVAVQKTFDYFTEEREERGHTYPGYFSEIRIRTSPAGEERGSKGARKKKRSQSSSAEDKDSRGKKFVRKRRW